MCFCIFVTGQSRIFEGDIKVFSSQLESEYGKDYASRMMDGGYVVDDMRRRALGADPNKRYHWPSGIVPYTFKDEDFTMAQKNEIIKNVNIMNSKVNPFVTFRPFNESTDKNYVVFKSDDTGCWSFLGMIGGPQTVNLGGNFCRKLSTVEHELMHAIGFWHEQSRQDRDDFVKVNYDNIADGMEGQFAKRSNLKDYGFKYDYRSVMHYGTKSFSKNGKPTIESINPPGSKLGNTVSMSSTDIAQVRAMYGEKDTTAAPTTPSPTPRPTKPQPTSRPTRPSWFVYCRKQKTRQRCRRHKSQCWWSKKRKKCLRRKI